MTVLGETQWTPTQPGEAYWVQEGSVQLLASLSSPLLDTDMIVGRSGVLRKWLVFAKMIFSPAPMT